MSTMPRMKDELIVRMKALVASLAKECDTCHHKTSSRCTSCWGFAAKSIMRDISMDEAPVTSNVGLRGRVAGAINAKEFTPISKIADLLGADPRSVSRVADELVKEKMAVRSGNWIKSK